MSTQAERSGMIVSSLFPEAFRDRLYEANEEGDQKAETEKKRIQGFLNQTSKMDENIENGVAMPKTRPIADVFPDTTILFADIAGFTKWSSSRDPPQVFTLLEALYGSFDAIARRRKVFKIETIGDCYVAATGLPEAQPDHAIIMTKFARDCLLKMTFLLEELTTELGPDTKDLDMRFGLHSGPVMAGVLRGEKSRFQIFGDTVNTAARMESTGVKHRIPASKSTADLIVGGGKAHWVKARNETVVAKGKGEIETFWLQPCVAGASNMGSADKDLEFIRDDFFNDS